jgi:hypothetical protein
MSNSYFTQQAGFARIEDLRRASEQRRLVALATTEGDRSCAGTRRRGRRFGALGSLRLRRPSTA